MIASPAPACNPSAEIAPILDEAVLAVATAALCAQDEVMAGLVARLGPPILRRRPPGYAGLAAIIVGQQLSTTSAAAIFGRLALAFDGPSAPALAAATDEALRACGLSTAKIGTLRACAAAEADGTVDLLSLAALPADRAHATLCSIKGVGPWTADLFLLFCLGHADAWPAGDLALQEAMRLVLALPTRPTARSMDSLAERWRPWRGVAAHVLWAYYAAAKGRNGVPAA